MFSSQIGRWLVFYLVFNQFSILLFCRFWPVSEWLGSWLAEATLRPDASLAAVHCDFGSELIAMWSVIALPGSIAHLHLPISVCLAACVLWVSCSWACSAIGSIGHGAAIEWCSRRSCAKSSSPGCIAPSIGAITRPACSAWSAPAAWPQSPFWATCYPAPCWWWPCWSSPPSSPPNTISSLYISSAEVSAILNLFCLYATC